MKFIKAAWREISLAVIGLGLIAVMLAGCGSGPATSGPGDNDNAPYGTIDVWVDNVNGVACYTRTGPLGFSCVKL